jgi:hypothetical protein
MLGVAFDNREDGVALHGNPGLAQELRRYIDGAEPLAACSYCLGSSGEFFDHRQLDEAGLKRDLSADPSAVLERLAPTAAP